MSAHPSAAAAPVDVQPAARPLTLGAALFVALGVAFGLALLALWPAGPWAPPARPGLNAPVVFDELLPPPVAPAQPTTPEPTAHR